MIRWFFSAVAFEFLDSVSGLRRFASPSWGLSLDCSPSRLW